jgi:thioredoxin-dependent peroxiredoxin
MLLKRTLFMAAALAVAAPVAAQEAETTPPLEVGAMAPDFVLPGATRHGILRDQVNLSDYRGQTVVLAFFFRARTRG